VARTVIRRLVAWDEAAGASVVLDPGESVQNWHLLQNTSRSPEPELGVYVMDFESAGRRLKCPLVQFQARTQFIVLQ
jgi:hypothetical protein